ncbi:hypothetical protein HQ571_05155 [Candidatus Kuenenbacteria bacterium]|nr:hypothetical protein [Candidatus Kuenenbacteria bacterium]
MAQDILTKPNQEPVIEPESREAEIKDEQVSLREIKLHTVELESFLSLENYPIKEGDFLHKNKDLYQFQNPNLVTRKVEIKERLGIIAAAEKQRRALDEEIPIAEVLELAQEKSELMLELVRLEKESKLDVDVSQKLEVGKRNRLRSNWAGFVLERLQLMSADFSEEKLGRDFGFDSLAVLTIGVYQAQRRMIRRESVAISHLEDAQDYGDFDDERFNLEVKKWQEKLEQEYELKKDLVKENMPALGELGLGLMKNLKAELSFDEKDETAKPKSERLKEAEELLVDREVSVLGASVYGERIFEFCDRFGFDKIKTLAGFLIKDYFVLIKKLRSGDADRQFNFSGLRKVSLREQKIKELTTQMFDQLRALVNISRKLL